MDEENVNDFTQSAIPTTGAPSFSQSIMPAIYSGQEKVTQGMVNMYQRREKEEKEKAEKLKKQNAIWNQQLLDMPDVFEQDYQEIKTKVDEYNDFIIAKKSAGEDMDNMSNDDIKKMKELQNQIRRAAIISKDNESYWEQLQKDIGNDETGKYDKEHAAKWNADYAKLSLEDKMKYRNSEDPRKLNYGLLDFVDETIPPNDKITDTGRVKITQKDPVEHKRIILETIRNTPVGMEQYDALKLPNETEEQFADRVVAEGQIRYKTNKDVQPAPQKSDKTAVGGYGTGNWNDKLSVSSQVNPSFKPGVAANTLYVTRTGTNDNVPPIQIADATGQTVNFQPISYHLRDDGAISVLGEVIKDTAGVQTKTQTWMDYDANKAAFQSQLMGMDLRQEFNARNGGTTGAATGSNTFIGVPQGQFNGQ
jgi:hypothetical protein